MKGRGFIFCLIACFLAASALGQVETDFKKANAEYGAGHFKEAIELYSNAIASGSVSANAFYDLANAYFRTGDFGHAILNYERALALDRHHPESRANLEIARDEARALELTPSKPQQLASFGTPSQYAITAAVGFWICIGSIVISIFSKSRTRTAIATSVFGFLLLGLGLFGAYLINSEQKAKAIVVADDVQARLATADNANSVLALPPGSEIKVVSRRGDWLYAELPNNLRGWIPAKAAENVLM